MDNLIFSEDYYIIASILQYSLNITYKNKSLSNIAQQTALTALIKISTFNSWEELENHPHLHPIVFHSLSTSTTLHYSRQFEVKLLMETIQNNLIDRYHFC